MSFTNAGLPLPVMKRNGDVRALSCSGPRLPLGSMRDVSYEEHSEALEQGDVLVLFTDGVSEAVNSHREFYGSERLHTLLGRLDTSALSASQIKDRIVRDVSQFGSGAPRHDDMTVVRNNFV